MALNYFDQILGCASTQKQVKIHNNCVSQMSQMKTLHLTKQVFWHIWWTKKDST